MERDKAKSFRDLIVWQKAHELVLMVYKVTKEFPREEQFGLVSQLRRSTVSVAANIAEAFKKKSSLDKLRILNISQGSRSESEYYFILAHDLNYSSKDNLMNRSIEVGKLLQSYMNAIKGR